MEWSCSAMCHLVAAAGRPWRRNCSKRWHSVRVPVAAAPRSWRWLRGGRSRGESRWSCRPPSFRRQLAWTPSLIAPFVNVPVGVLVTAERRPVPSTVPESLFDRTFPQRLLRQWQPRCCHVPSPLRLLSKMRKTKLENI